MRNFGRRVSDPHIKLCSLLGRYVYISCSHIYENSHTRQLLLDNPDLLTCGIVAIGLRSDCRYFGDLLALRKEEGRQTTESDLELSRFLDEHTAVVIRWTPMDVQPLFRANILAALQDPDSLLRRRLRGTRKASVTQLSKNIFELPDEAATRSTIHHLATMYLPHRRNAFRREVNLLYYVMGSADKNLRPHLSPVLFTDLDRGCRTSLTSGRERPLGHWVEEMLREMLFPADVIDLFTVEQLAFIREKHAAAFDRFRRNWWRIVGSGTEMEIGGVRPTERDIVNRLIEEAKKPEKRSLGYKRATKWVSISSLLLSAASLIPHPLLAALSFLVSAGTFALSQKRVEHTLLGTDFAALTTVLKHHARLGVAQQASAHERGIVRR